jgi:hypothetical protein
MRARTHAHENLDSVVVREALWSAAQRLPRCRLGGYQCGVQPPQSKAFGLFSKQFLTRRQRTQVHENEVF